MRRRSFSGEREAVGCLPETISLEYSGRGHAIETCISRVLSIVPRCIISTAVEPTLPNARRPRVSRYDRYAGFGSPCGRRRCVPDPVILMFRVPIREGVSTCPDFHR
jgi:hypothetical protein